MCNYFIVFQIQNLVRANYFCCSSIPYPGVYYITANKKQHLVWFRDLMNTLYMSLKFLHMLYMLR